MTPTVLYQPGPTHIEAKNAG